MTVQATRWRRGAALQWRRRGGAEAQRRGEMVAVDHTTRVLIGLRTLLPEVSGGSSHRHAPARELAAAVVSLGGGQEPMQEPRGLVLPKEATVLAEMARSDLLEQAARRRRGHRSRSRRQRGIHSSQLCPCKPARCHPPVTQVHGLHARLVPHTQDFSGPKGSLAIYLAAPLTAVVLLTR